MKQGPPHHPAVIAWLETAHRLESQGFLEQGCLTTGIPPTSTLNTTEVADNLKNGGPGTSTANSEPPQKKPKLSEQETRSSDKESGDLSMPVTLCPVNGPVVGDDVLDACDDMFPDLFDLVSIN